MASKHPALKPKIISDPIEAAVEVEEKQTAQRNGTDPNVVTVSTGVQFRVKAVNRHSLGGITERYLKEKPKPPIVFIENKGREEPNYDDPDYQDTLQSWNTSLAMAITNFILLRGADAISIPDDLLHYESDDWQFEVELIGGSPDNPRACYLEWLKAVACTEDDINKLLGVIGRKSGIAQEDVDQAVSQFRG